MKNRIARIFPIFVFLIFLALPPLAKAKGLLFIRDAEVESTIRAFTRPLLVAAGLNPESVKIHLVKDNSLNAFVAGGQNIFIHTGLIAKTRDAGALIGVIAHETGHISAGHLVRSRDAIEGATRQSILGIILGGAATLSGRGDVGAAIVRGTQMSSLRNFFQFSRTQEAAADRSAARFLDKTGQSARGLHQFLEALLDQELLSRRHQDPYFQTHPMTGNRLNFLDQHMARSRYTETPLSPLFERLHRRMKAKLNAFLLPPRQTLRKYPPADKSVAARYARAIAYYLIPELDKALAEINWLIAHERGNPYFHELKGQMLFENGKIAASIAPYQAAVDLNPKSALLRLGLGMALIESKDPSALPVVISNLRVAVAVEPRMSQAWRQLAIGYGRTGQMAKSFLALAEEAILHRRFKDALNHGEKAKRLIKPGTPDWLAAGDVIAAANAGNKKRH